MKKILFCASTWSHINNFHLPYIQAFRENGWEVHVLINEDKQVVGVDEVKVVNFEKNIMSIKNIKSIIQARHLLKAEQYDVVSVHTTLAAAILRLAVLTLKNKPRVVYTCHGYLFNEQTSLKQMIYVGVEKICANVTHTLMVMNKEDLQLAQHYKLFKNNVFFIDGMGINLKKFSSITTEEKEILKQEKGFQKNDILYTYAAEFSNRKNHRILIENFGIVREKMPQAQLLLAGSGQLLDEMKQLIIDLNLEHCVHFLGYVKDIAKLYQMSDIAISTSKIEGLPFNIMEAMACGLPIIASNIKGHKELVQHGENGVLFNLKVQEDIQNALIELYSDENLRKIYGENSKKQVERYDVECVLPTVMNLYKNINK